LYRGPVERVGCLEKIINWVPPYLNASGALMIFAAFFQVNFFLMSLIFIVNYFDYGYVPMLEERRRT